MLSICSPFWLLELYFIFVNLEHACYSYSSGTCFIFKARVGAIERECLRNIPLRTTEKMQVQKSCKKSKNPTENANEKKARNTQNGYICPYAIHCCTLLNIVISCCRVHDHFCIEHQISIAGFVFKTHVFLVIRNWCGFEVQIVLEVSNHIHTNVYCNDWNNLLPLDRCYRRLHVFFVNLACKEFVDANRTYSRNCIER